MRLLMVTILVMMVSGCELLRTPQEHWLTPTPIYETFWKPNASDVEVRKVVHECFSKSKLAYGQMPKNPPELVVWRIGRTNMYHDCILAKGYVFYNTGRNNDYRSYCKSYKKEVRKKIKVCNQ